MILDVCTSGSIITVLTYASKVQMVHNIIILGVGENIIHLSTVTQYLSLWNSGQKKHLYGGS